MTDSNGRAATAPRARKPWEDELARLAWFEHRFGTLADDLRDTARELTETITPAADGARRAELDARAAEVRETASEIDGLIAASHAGPGAGDLDWAAWHAGRAGWHIARAVAVSR